MDPCNNVKKPKYMHLQWDLVLKKKKNFSKDLWKSNVQLQQKFKIT